jgi:hypothetical protein
MKKFLKILHVPFATMAYLVEVMCLSALLTLKVEMSVICLVGTQIRTLFIMKESLSLPFKTLIINTAQKCRLLKRNDLRFK